MTSSAASSVSAPANSNYVFRIALVAAVGGFLFGYDLSVVSGAILFLKREFNLTPSAEGFAVSSAMLGCLIGPFGGCMIADRIGRKPTLILASLLFGICSIGTTLPPNMFWFNLFRIIGGVGVGIASVVSPMYIAEIAPARIRGSLVTMNQLAIVLGSVASIVVSYFLAEGGHWRWMFASAMVPIAALLVGLALIPESPRWLFANNRQTEAEDVLARIDGAANARREIAEIRNALGAEQGSWRELTGPGLRMALLVAIGIAMFQQFTGMSAISFYFPVIFARAGFDAQSAIGQNVLVNIWQIFCTVGALWLIDRAGRRPLLLFGTLGMALGLFALGMVFHLKLTGRAVLLAVLFANGSYLISLAPLGWLIMSEIFPNRVRGLAMGLCGMLLWIAAFSTTYIFPPMRDYFERHTGSPAGAFWLFAGVCVLSFIFSYFLVPETKGRSLEEIGAMWGDRLRHGNGQRGPADAHASLVKESPLE